MTIRAPKGTARRWRIVAGVALLVLITPNVSMGYAVLAHEAIIDSMWDSDIVPVLHAKFPRATADQLREAHSYAYGGSIIQDMGYYPFGSLFYTDLTHYVRSGGFVQALLSDAGTLDEYAFAVGALSHYYADISGHRLSTNPAVAVLYPKLRAQFGETVTYEDKPSAHIQTEFGFDVLQVARGHYASEAYHDFVGFRVSKELLQRAFVETYGIELNGLFTDLDLALGSYRHAVSTVIPAMTRVAWQSMKKDIEKSDSAAVTPRSLRYQIARADYNKEWGATYQRPGFFSRVLSFLFRLVPKIGPLKGLAIKAPTPESERLFARGINAIVESYRGGLMRLRTGALTLPDWNLDMGRQAKAGEYVLADATFARLVGKLAGDKYAHVTPALRSVVVAYFADTTPRVRSRKDAEAWSRTQRDLEGLRNSPPIAR